MYSHFTFEPVKADDTIFTIVAHKANQRYFQYNRFLCREDRAESLWFTDHNGPAHPLFEPFVGLTRDIVRSYSPDRRLPGAGEAQCLIVIRGKTSAGMWCSSLDQRITWVDERTSFINRTYAVG
jgi:hypothetical protein